MFNQPLLQPVTVLITAQNDGGTIFAERDCQVTEIAENGTVQLFGVTNHCFFAPASTLVKPPDARNIVIATNQNMVILAIETDAVNVVTMGNNCPFIPDATVLTGKNSDHAIVTVS